MKRKLEDDSSCTRKIPNNKNLVDNNLSKVQAPEFHPDQKILMEIDDDNDDDLEILYACYPSTDYEISSFDKIIKDENNTRKSTSAQSEAHNISCPKTYKLTITKRNSYQQRLFRNELLKHYKQCIITGVSWDVLLDAAHIMPFKQVGSYLSTGFPLRKDIHCLWDRFHVSINPEIWTVLLSEQAFNFSNCSEYNNFKLLDETIILLKKADIQILKQHYDKFKELQHFRKYQTQNKVDKPKTPNKKFNKEALARPKNKEDACYDKFITAPMETIMYYVDFISQIWENNDNTKEWFKPCKDVPKSIIYSAFVRFNNKKNGKSLSEDDFTDRGSATTSEQCSDQKKKVFWQNMYNVICKSTGKKLRKRFTELGLDREYYIRFFSEEEIIQNVKKMAKPSPNHDHSEFGENDRGEAPTETRLHFDQQPQKQEKR
jgi:hypothetical protein